MTFLQFRLVMKALLCIVYAMAFNGETQKVQNGYTTLLKEFQEWEKAWKPEP